ncbi:hypothetical protein ELI_2612 [Eubacterium callanderi]|uniref:Uncharacterized protein n=1 Tax=Eubacterium callanderi TaxID=53442 RepID=E3GN99_9FIRM|nr:hypothetical protein ELI_2612 [Eubacterium callanderi]
MTKENRIACITMTIIIGVKIFRIMDRLPQSKNLCFAIEHLVEHYF